MRLELLEYGISFFRVGRVIKIIVILSKRDIALCFFVIVILRLVFFLVVLICLC